jgi:hypothetical protein
VTAGVSDRGWWLRRKANTADVAPWDEGFLSRWTAEQVAHRKRVRRELRPLRRRLARKAAES